MRLNRDVLISAIVRHQSTFFKLLDYIDNHDGALEFPEYLYINLYNVEICRDDDTNTHIHLSAQSLLENGVFIHNDKNTGMTTIERVIVELLRFLDIKRAKELTYFDFEHLRKRTNEITQEMMLLDSEGQDYRDAKSAFNELMSEIHSKVKENVSALTIQVESIAKDYKIYDDGNSAISVFDLYEKVTTLYTRYVLPCYEFINPDMEMVRTKTFSKSVQELIEYHSEEGVERYDTANAFQYRKTAITSYYKNISALVRKLEQFSNHLERDRNYFLAIESAYSDLMNSIIPLRHGKQRNIYLTPSADVFSTFSSLDGLSKRKSKFSTRFKWNKEATKLRFKEYLAVINETHIKEKKKPLKSLPPEINVTQERQILITKVLFNSKVPETLPNIHQFIFRTLCMKLKDFILADVLYGLEAFIPMQEEGSVIPTFTQEHLTDNTYYLNYIILELRKETADV